MTRRRGLANLASAGLLTAGACLLCACTTSTPTVPSRRDTAATPTIYGLELLGEAVLSSTTVVDGAAVGGLSSIAYDADRDLYYAVSDDPGSRGPARFLTLAIDLSDAALGAADVEVVALTELLDVGGEPFAEMTLDLEGLALSSERTLYVSSEGQVSAGVDPFLREYRLDGSYVRDLPLPLKFLPEPDRQIGIRHNLGFEAVALDTAGKWVFTATENALAQDGPVADVGVGSPVRILRFDRASARPGAEFVYLVEPVHDAPVGTGDFRTRGLVELVALDDSNLLALERAYTEGVGNTADIFLVSLNGATDVGRWRSFEGKSFRPVAKTRLLALKTLGLELDNLEGMAFGPTLADGRRSLVLVADNNFNPSQRNQILAFALEEQELTPARIQGSDHRSPLEGAWVRGVQGTVTSRSTRGPGFWLQGPDDRDPTTSDALFVLAANDATADPGDIVQVEGLVRETGHAGDLTTTSLEEAGFRRLGRSALPPAVRIGADGRALPTRHIDDDGLTIFDPTDDAIDFLESLEGMRVEISGPVVVGPTSRFGDFAVVPDGHRAGVRSAAGGLVATSTANGPAAILVAARAGLPAPQVSVGDRFEGAITGVLEYSFGAFRLAAEAAGPVSERAIPAYRPAPPATGETLSVATYNLENLSAQSGSEKFERLASSIVAALASPDILAVQEVQDDSGPEDDGTVSAERTLALLRQAIAAAGGAEYESVAIDPQNLADGGQPGANIRVAYLYRPDRVRFVRRGAPDPATPAEWLLDERGPFLSPNPARIQPGHPAFAADSERRLGGARKPLATEFEFNNRRLYLVNVHLRSKRGDASLFGGIQPPPRPTEELRSAEARVIGSFLGDLLELDPNAAAIVLGDFNEHPYRRPLSILASSGLRNLVEHVPESQRYTFIFRGNSQVLDNVLVTESLAAETAPAIEIAHVNSDFPHGRRASDHDPIVVRFQIPARVSAQEDS